MDGTNERALRNENGKKLKLGPKARWTAALGAYPPEGGKREQRTHLRWLLLPGFFYAEMFLVASTSFSSVNKSTGPFDALFCVGQFFPDSSERLEEFLDHVEGRSPVPLPTYFIGDYGIGTAKVLAPALKANPGFKTDGLKICDNLYWLKGSGKFSLLGLSIAYLSGRPASGGQPIGTYTEDDVDALRALAEEPGAIDLFLTYP
ncbi:hypothetical protein ACLOJK_039992 [Asimina triloba]